MQSNVLSYAADLQRDVLYRFEDSQHEISTDEELLLLAGLELKTGEKIANVYSQ